MVSQTIELTYALAGPEDIDEWIKLSTNLLWTTPHQKRKVRLIASLKTDLQKQDTTKDLIIEPQDPREQITRIAETIEYINTNPLFNLNITQIKTVYNPEHESPYIHKALKTGRLTEPPTKAVQVSPLTFHALTTGIHRHGISQKFMIAQHNFTEDLSQHLKLNIQPPTQNNPNTEKHGSLAAIATSMLTATQIPPQVYRGGLTTTIWRIKPEETQHIRRESTKLLKLLHQNTQKQIKLHIEQENGRTGYTVQIGKDKCQINTIGNKTFGRILRKLQKILQDIEKATIEGETITLAIESTEQRGPLDLKAIQAKLQAKQTHIKETILITTPLTLLPTYITLKHTQTHNPRKIILSSGTDKKRITNTINHILKKLNPKDKLIYIHGGTTLHTAIATHKLKKEKRTTILPNPKT